MNASAMAGLRSRKYDEDTAHELNPGYQACEPIVVPYVQTYVERLDLPTDALRIATSRAVFEKWLRRKVSSSYGGAYVFLRREGVHAILINLDRINLENPKALEVVVAEELLHMRDYLDGDYRRHWKHGHDRIAYRVADLTDASLEEIRGALIPIKRRPYKYLYACPGCGVQVPRKQRGRWSCSRCSPVFDPRYILRIVKTEGRE